MRPAVKECGTLKRLLANETHNAEEENGNTHRCDNPRNTPESSLHEAVETLEALH